MKIFTKFVIFFIWFAAVFDPIGNLFGLRYLAMGFFLLNVTLIPIFIKIRLVDVYWRGTFILVLSFIMPTYGCLIYFLHTRGEEFIDTSYLASGLLILYSLLYWSKDITESALRTMILILRLLVFVIFFSAFLQTQNSDVLNFFTERDIAIIGFRNYAGIQFPYIYFLASPLLIFLLVYDLNKIVKKISFFNFISFFFTSVALVLSGTRAHMLMPILVIPIYFLLKTSLVKKIYYLPGFILIFIMTFFLSDTIFNLFKEFFSAKEGSNEVKISLLSGYIEIFSNPFTFLFGQGYNAHEWSSVLRTMILMENKASKTELTYIEILRVYGVFFFTIFIFMLYFLLKKLKSISSYYWLYLSFTLYLLNSSINPYLFSTNGMLPFGIVLAVVYFKSPNTSI
ncbi:hypothetical protein SAMN05444143_101785 [Flavobacterium succinicans]|uniref:O-Antigen ligase n=1 Tax=Flavobacterium succinicans TaxID=29536 RepID=A0A1I4SDQ8_9FLAO|nr:O-antigen polymerase [Flavobacterium succinicans]SFM62595.1 hypothetical protein SAMN05444143_101785 [Flavobacterium succinicans]